MSSYISLIVLLVLLFGMVAFTVRARRRQAEALAQENAELERQAEAIGVGSQVMTTSGLYGTVTALGDDGSVQLRIAAGVEVRWALAALLEVDALPDRYRGGAGGVGHTDARPSGQTAQ